MWIFGLIFLIPGGGILWYSWTVSADIIEFQKTALKTEGIVLEYKTWEKSDSKRGRSVTMYNPVVQYRIPVSDTVYILESQMSSSEPDYEIGEQVSLLYDPANPDHAKIDSLMNLYFGPVISAVLGLVFSFVGLMFIRNSFTES